MSVSFGGFNKKTATFKTSSAMQKGTPVKISENGTVAAAGIGNPFCGIVDDYDGQYAAVQLYGAVTTTYVGAAPPLGYTKLIADNVNVKCGEAGREYLVLSVDEEASTVTFLM